MTTATKPVDREAQERERFLRDTAKHTMRVHHDDGLYRHLRFMRPGGFEYHYDLITWPGHLVICGDMADLHFSRTKDMFEFFAGSNGAINPYYWGEKLQGPIRGRESVLKFDVELYVAAVKEWQSEVEESIAEEAVEHFRKAVQDQLLSEWTLPHTREAALGLLHDFQDGHIYIDDAYDWALTDWDGTYLWGCWAIVEGIARYQHAKGWA